jgi:dTDP-glucose 4,6-dehydratase/UDP-glucose 4-epimerase
MRILIIGSEGFIGRHCVLYFMQMGWEVYGCDLLDYASVKYNYTKISRLQPSFSDVFTKTKYDACINASGNGSVPVSITYPLSDFEANCSDVIRILEFIRLKNHKCKYIHISSAAVYGNPQQLPVAESVQLSPLSPYGWHKLIAENICREYHQLYKIPIVIVRPFSIYGPGLRKQIFWDIYTKFKETPENITLWGTGKESRDFIYIDDMVLALKLILEASPMQADVYNLASGNELTIQDAANMLIENLSAVKVNFNNQQRPGDPINWRADISKLNTLNYTPKYTFAQGIKQTAQWLKDLL